MQESQAQSAVIVRFPGNPDELLPRYGEALRRFREADPATAPVSIFAGRSEASPDALVVVILWPQGIDHHVMGGFIFQRLAEFGLPRPQVDHMHISRTGFDAISVARG